jgi:hypothetical protein
MIEFQTWIEQMIRYCHLICDDSILKNAWIDHIIGITSVTDFEELYVQIFDDLDADNFRLELPTHLKDNLPLCEAVIFFLDSIREFDVERDGSSQLTDPSVFLASRQWKAVQSSALAVIALSSQAKT